MTPTTPDDDVELRKDRETIAAARGPWRINHTSRDMSFFETVDVQTEGYFKGSRIPLLGFADGVRYAERVLDRFPVLVAEIDRLKAEVDRLRKAVHDAGRH